MERPNLNYIKDISGGDKAFERELIQILKKEFPKELQEYHEAMKNQEFSIAAERVHKVRHKISILGLSEGFELSSKYESGLKSGNPENFQEDFERLLVMMGSFIQSL